MYDHNNVEDTKFCYVVLNKPYIPTKEGKDGELNAIVVKTRKSTMKWIGKR